MWPLEHLDKLYHNNSNSPGELFWNSVIFLALLASIAVCAREMLFHWKMRRNFGPRWRDNIDSKLKEHDQNMANLLSELNVARAGLRGTDLSDNALERASHEFATCMKKVSRFRKVRDRAYSLAFNPIVGKSEEAEKRIRAGLPPATQEKNRQEAA